MTLEDRSAGDDSLTPQARLLNQITTRWSIVNDPAKVVVRYAPAIRGYLQALLRDPHDADEVAQEFAVHVLNHKFDNASPQRGRFRDYVKVAARNAALGYLRRRKRGGKATTLSETLERTLPNDSDPDPISAANDEWIVQWRRCLLDKVWRAIEVHEQRSPGNLYYTALRLSVDLPEEDSESLAARVSAKISKPMRADAFRKQLSRGRRMFAELLVEEVAATMHQPSASEIEEELSDLGLMSYLKDYLPEEE